MYHFDEVSNFNTCLVHSYIEPFKEDDTYIQIFIDTKEPRKYLHFVVCNENCAAIHMQYWLNRKYTVTFWWSTPIFRAETQAKIDAWKSPTERNNDAASIVHEA